LYLKSGTPCRYRRGTGGGDWVETHSPVDRSGCVSVELTGSFAPPRNEL
jgi:hypothetical protein